jgi:hypothetical protein
MADPDPMRFRAALTVLLGAVTACGGRIEGGLPVVDVASQDAAGDVAANTACSPRPAIPVLLATLPGLVSALSVQGSTLFAGSSSATPQGVFTGAVSTIALNGGGSGAIDVRDYLGGQLVPDGATLFYETGTLETLDSGNEANSIGGLAVYDEKTGTAVTLSVPATPTQLATPSSAGLFWLGEPMGPGGSPTTLYVTDTTTLASAAMATGGLLLGVAVDEGAVYWADTGGTASQTSVFSLPLEGGTPSLLASVPWSQSRGWLVGLTSTSVVFVSDGGNAPGTPGAIMAVDKKGGAPRTVVTTGLYFTWVDGEDVYWGDDLSQTLLRAPVAGGPTEVIWQAEAHGSLFAVAFDACNLYVSTVTGSVYARGK